MHLLAAERERAVPLAFLELQVGGVLEHLLAVGVDDRDVRGELDVALAVELDGIGWSAGYCAPEPGLVTVSAGWTSSLADSGLGFGLAAAASASSPSACSRRPRSAARRRRHPLESSSFLADGHVSLHLFIIGEPRKKLLC